MRHHWRQWSRIVVVGVLVAILVTISFSATSGTQRASDSTEREPLLLDLPDPAFVNRNSPLRVPDDIRLSPHPLQPREPFYVPPDVENVARDRPVRASAEPVVGSLDMATDGDKQAIDDRLIHLPPGPQWVEVDLQEEVAIHAIVFWLNHTTDYVFRGVIVQIANDPEFKRGVTTLFNNDHNNIAGHGRGEHLHYIESFEGKLVPGFGLNARYVRIHTNGNILDDLNYYTEVEVWGQPVTND